MTNLTLKLSGQIPSGKNAVKITRTGQRYPDNRFKEWRNEALHQWAKQVLGFHQSVKNWPITDPVTLIIDYTPADQRRRDMPGMLDALCHLLEKAEIVKDDAQVIQCTWKTFAPDKERAGVTMTVLA